jgi:ubiquinone/menaquinone biosynthesis C-methylase UbiE
MSVLHIFGISIGVVALSLVTWRVLNYYYHLPCPPFFIFILESKLMDRVAGPEAIIQRAGIQPGMSVLDGGCGPGRLTVPIAKFLGPEGLVVALDMQEEMLKRLGQRVAAQGVTNIKPIQAGLGEGVLEGYAFDRAILVTVLGEIPDQEKALLEIHQVLVPGGLLSITELLPDPHFQSRKKVTRLAARAGFKVEPVFSSWRSYTLNLVRP